LPAQHGSKLENKSVQFVSLGAIGQTIYGDVPGQELLDFRELVLNYQEQSLEKIPFTVFSADYVYRETKREHAGLEGTKTLLWPGIDIDIPTVPGHSKCTPEGTKGVVRGVPRRSGRRHSVAKVFGDEVGQLKGSGPSVSRARLGLDAFQ
jgi:hypothetical protein